MITFIVCNVCQITGSLDPADGQDFLLTQIKDSVFAHQDCIDLISAGFRYVGGQWIKDSLRVPSKPSFTGDANDLAITKNPNNPIPDIKIGAKKPGSKGNKPTQVIPGIS